jgi:acetylglutamate kinase
MLNLGTASGGMSPKIEASIKALSATPIARIINGKIPDALLNEMENGIGGTSIVPK